MSSSFIQYNHQERVDELNQRIFSRLYSEQPLQPHFYPRPVMTKFSFFPIVDQRKESSVAIAKCPDYQVGKSSIYGHAPFEGYQNQVETESDLRNQGYALSSAPHRHYVPSSSSDLYNLPSVSGSLQDEQPFPQLFDFGFDVTRVASSSFHPIGEDVGSQRFFNSTRAQLKGDGRFAR